VRFPDLLRVSRLVAIVAAALLWNVPFAAAGQADFGGYRPHYQGFGVDTPGGRGGTVYRVTTLSDSGPGSLRDALTRTGARIVVFEISGTIALASPIYITNPFLTVAGQTAPSPGITVRNHSIFVDTNDVVLQHLRLRMGDATCVNNCASGGADALYVRNNAYNVVLDHLSLSWGTHGGLSVNAWSGQQPYEIAMLDCIVSENLAKPLNPYGVGTLFMPSGRGTATFARNLHAHNGNRMPWVSPGWKFAGYNNVAYNAGSVFRDTGTFAFFQVMGGYNFLMPYDVAWTSNVSLAGPDTHPDGKPVKVDMRASEVSLGNRLYIADNSGPSQTLADQWKGVTFMDAASEARTKASVAPAWHTNFHFSILPNPEVLPYVLANAGARPLDRDSVDERVVKDVKNGTGHRIGSPAEVGGYPVLAEVRRTLSVPANANEVVDAVGRTRIEVWLESYARALEPGARTSAPALSAPRNLKILQ
jgi:hypothetical protein